MTQTNPRELFQHGIELFNREEFFECHEVLEEVWTPTTQPDRWFLQSLIHFAVGFYHHRRGNKTGAVNQLRKGLRKIEGYLPRWGGVETGQIAEQARQCLERIQAGGRVAQFPKIKQYAPWEGPGNARGSASSVGGKTS